jgi:hypothetical protein
VRPVSVARGTVGATLLAAAGYAVAVLLLSWPIAAAPGTTLIDPLALGGAGSIWTKADLDLLVWILAWTSHALLVQPLSLFQANIFHPAPDALASSEHLIGLAPVAAPIFWLSGNAVLTYNVTVLVVVWACALCTFVLVRAWTGSSAAAFFSGTIFALGPQLVSSWIRLHSSAVYFFPLILLLAAAAARAPRPRTLALLALVSALQALAGVYVAFELLVLVAAFFPALWLEARRNGRSVLAPAAAIALGVLALLPTAFPYLRIRAAGQLPDLAQARELIRLASPSWALLRALIVPHVTWPVLALALLGTVRSARVPWNLRLGVLLVGVVGTLFTAGTTVSLVPGTGLPSAYELAMLFVPGFAGMRAPSRFVVLPLLAIAVLAGIGAVQLVDLAARRSARAARLAGVLLVAASVALIVIRQPRPPWPVAPASLAGPLGVVDRWLRDHGEPGPVLELPAMTSIMNTSAMLATGRGMVGSTLHWLPLLNGYSGHPPASDAVLMTLAERLPDPVALDALCALAGPHWLVVHFGQMAADAEQRFTARQDELGLEPLARFGKTVIYRLSRPCTSRVEALRRQLAGQDADRTLGGNPQRALSPAATRGTLSAHLPASLPAGAHLPLWLDVANLGDAVWPGLSLATRGRVEIGTRWRDASGAAVLDEGERLPLARDLAPGESLRAQANLLAPTTPGVYVLEVVLEQNGVGPLQDASGQPIVLRGPVLVTAQGGVARPGPPASGPVAPSSGR